jgi:hypothetical protein
LQSKRSLLFYASTTSYSYSKNIHTPKPEFYSDAQEKKATADPATPNKTRYRQNCFSSTQDYSDQTLYTRAYDKPNQSHKQKTFSYSKDTAYPNQHNERCQAHQCGRPREFR